MSTVVQDVLDVDKKFRHDGVSGDLFPLRSIQSKDWDYPCPTLIKEFNEKNDDRFKTIKLETNIAKFKQRFETTFPFLANVNLDNMLVAGGIVGKMVIDKAKTSTWYQSDIDVFVWGLSEDQASARVEKFLEDVFYAYELHLTAKAEEGGSEQKTKKAKTKKTFSFECVRTPTTLTLKIGGIKLQIIFRLYKNISEILHGFDLGSCALGYDGNEVWFTTLGKFAYEYGCNIIDPSRRSTTYEHRLSKYFDRGFEIVLPDLDVRKLPTRYLPFDQNEILIMPYFQVIYNDLKGNCIVVSSIKYKGDVASDYSALESLNDYNTFFCNVHNLVKKNDFFYHYIEKHDADAADAKTILRSPPNITRRRLIQFYDSLPTWALGKGKFSFNRFFKYVNLLPEAELGQQLFGRQGPDRFKYIEELAQKQGEIALRRWDELEKIDYTRIKWIVQSPGSQFTGSFNPVLSNPADWYGEYLMDGERLNQ